jgi:26S proteasome regulatory subunit N12
MSNQSTDLATLVTHLQKSFHANQTNSLPPQLTRLKLLLTTQSLLTPTPSTPPHLLTLSRTVFEIGAYTSILLKDKQSFVHYISYLHDFYALNQGGPHEAELTGLNLLRLLAENKIAGFHTQLEILAEGIRESGPVLFARGLEEWVMEGAYNRVWKAGEGKGVSVYQKFFLDVLMDTIRYDPGCLICPVSCHLLSVRSLSSSFLIHYFKFFPSPLSQVHSSMSFLCFYLRCCVYLE